MKRLITIAATTFALAGALIAATAAPAVAAPTKTIACSGCHAASSAVKVAVTRASATAKTVTYRVRVTGGSGAAGWAVLSGGRNLTHRLSATGTFTVAKGRSIRVWGVRPQAGSASRALVAR